MRLLFPSCGGAGAVGQAVFFSVVSLKMRLFENWVFKCGVVWCGAPRNVTDAKRSTDGGKATVPSI